MNLFWSAKKMICQRRAKKLMNQDKLLDSFLESYLQTIDVWGRNPNKIRDLNFNVNDPVIVLEKWLSYEGNVDLCQMRNLLYRVSVDFSKKIGLLIAPLVIHNSDRFNETGVCIPLENDSTVSSLITLPSFEPDYVDWQLPLITSLAHEIGHAFVYQNWRSSYNLQTWLRAKRTLQLPDIAWKLVFNVWHHNWFHELLADLIAAVLLGPAGIYWDQKEYITMRRSKNQPINVGSRTHPPDLLRTFWKVELLDGTNTPSSVIDGLKAKVCTPYSGMTLDFTELGQRYVLSQSVVNHFFSMATDWLRHYGITYDWNEIENRRKSLSQGQIPQDGVGLTCCALLHVALNDRITSYFDTVVQMFGGPLS